MLPNGCEAQQHDTRALPRECDTSSMRERMSIRKSLLVQALIATLALFALSGAGRPAATRAQAAPLVLVAGWNNFAYLGPVQPVLAGLSSLNKQYDALWNFDASSQSFRLFKPATPDTSDFTDLTQGAAYWIHMLQPATLVIGQVGV